jgi:hypothetical protein
MSEHSTATCKICQERKSQIEFPQHINRKLMPDGSYMPYNANRRSCFNCLTKQQKDSELRRFGSEEGRREYKRSRTRKCMFKKFGISLEEADSILDMQKYKCPICNKQITLDTKADRINKAALDHCHTTGKFRSFLCPTCNSGLGYFKDDPILLESAIDYLKRHPSD